MKIFLALLAFSVCWLPALHGQTSTGANCPAARFAHTAVWTGAEMIVWGGFDGSTYFNNGGRYNPANNTWQPVSSVGAPSARAYHTAV